MIMDTCLILALGFEQEVGAFGRDKVVLGWYSKKVRCQGVLCYGLSKAKIITTDWFIYKRAQVKQNLRSTQHPGIVCNFK